MTSSSPDCRRGRAIERPNILFVFTDDHAPHAIGAYNGWLKSINPTPVIDKLAREGMLFEKSFCSNSICGPSRAVILSGKHSHKNGFMNNGNSFDWNQQIFPKILRKNGYQTALYGKSHLKGKPQGFDDWAVLPGQGLYYNPDMIFASRRRSTATDRRGHRPRGKLAQGEARQKQAVRDDGATQGTAPELDAGPTPPRPLR